MMNSKIWQSINNMTDVKKAWLPASFCINIGTRDKGTGAHRELQNIFRLSPIQWL